jgi:predicted Zn-ribbon and HTH transcriptional regulator
MNYSLGKEGFENKAKGIHGNKYDYSLVEYVNSNTHVKIICPTHGEFSQKPHEHYRSKGCSKCSAEERGLKMRHTKEKFVEKAMEVHGDLYDYSKVYYQGCDNKVEIICSIHGSFWQNPNDHTSDKNGCPECSKIRRGVYRRKTTTQFIEDAIGIHGDNYDYSKVEYLTSYDKVIITCKHHGDFEQIAVRHLQGRRCPSCLKEDTISRGGKGLPKMGNRLKQQDFIKRANDKYNEAFDYTKTVYERMDSEIIIRCKKHDFEYTQLASTHINGSRGGCSKCKSEAISKTFLKTNETFIEEALAIHEGHYDYSQTKYTNSKNKVNIICPHHGVFEQTPNDHLNGHGCKKCGQKGSTYNITKAERNKEDWSKIQTVLYLIELKSENEHYLKIGISNEKVLRHSVLERVSKCKIVDSLVIDIDLYNAVIIEQTTLKDMKSCKYLPLYNYPGYTECFILACKDSIKSSIGNFLK